ITSFLSAIEIFAKNIDRGCDFLQTSSYKFVYTTGENTVTVACIDRNDDEKNIRNDLEIIQQEFLSRYSRQLKEWSGRVEQFGKMKEFVDNQLKKYSLKIEDLSRAKLELNPAIRRRESSLSLSSQQQKVISLLKYKGTATLHDIVKLMKLNETDAEKAARMLIYNNVIRQVQNA
ncbi:MAG: hypothetical protein ACTSX6_13220, partial [Candidatus Heimdallarchaeaceae archaeon]